MTWSTTLYIYFLLTHPPIYLASYLLTYLSIHTFSRTYLHTYPPTYIFFTYLSCRNANLGLTTKARVCKVAKQEGSSRVKESVKEWTLTLPKKLPLCELESQWTPECSESDYKGQNPMARGVFYTIGKVLIRKCLKWACMTYLDIWNTSYGQKKGREWNWQFDSRPLKLKNWFDFLVCKWRVGGAWHTIKKALDEGYNFIWDLISIGGLHTKLWGPKVARISTLVILGLPLGNP